MRAEFAVYVINLAFRTDRRTALQKELSRIGSTGEFFPAVRPDGAGDFPSIGARGCFLSHLAVLKQAQAASAEQLVILEDDVNFADDFSERWPSAIAELSKQDWSIFYPAHFLRDLPPGLSRLPAERDVKCTHFMVINRQAIDPLVHGLEAILSRPPGHPMGGPMHVDGAYSTLRYQSPALRTYAYSPPLGYQRPSRTDIGDPQWFDRIGVFAPVVEMARRARARLRP